MLQIRPRTLSVPACPFLFQLPNNGLRNVENGFRSNTPAPPRHLVSAAVFRASLYGHIRAGMEIANSAPKAKISSGSYILATLFRPVAPSALHPVYSAKEKLPTRNCIVLPLLAGWA